MIIQFQVVKFILIQQGLYSESVYPQVECQINIRNLSLTKHSRFGHIAIPSLKLVVPAVMDFEDVVPAVVEEGFNKTIILPESNILERQVGSIKEGLQNNLIPTPIYFPAFILPVDLAGQVKLQYSKCAAQGYGSQLRM